MCKSLETSKFEWAILTRGSGDKAVALYQYFQPSNGLPDPSGSLSASVSHVTIKDANEAVRSTTQSKPRVNYAKFIPKQQAVIGKYASLHSNQVAILKKLGVEMKVTLVQMHTKIQKKKKKIFSVRFIAIYTKICTSKISRL